MKQFISNIKNLSQKAAEIKAAMQQVPPKVAEIREAVAATTGQLQQLKSEIQHSVADLKADNEGHLSDALQEINASTDVFAKAGFMLSGVDLEISPVQRMLVHLTRVDDVHPSMLRSLVSANQHRRTTQAILSSLLQAQQMADTVELNHLHYSEVVVGIGPIPSVRLCWQPEEVEEVQIAQPPAIPLPPPLASSTPAPQSVFGASSFFEKRLPQSEPASVATESITQKLPAIKVSLPVASPVAAATTHVGPGAEATKDPLARFKKMPDLAKLRK
jgi:hypothetical protein